jgi:hypothetical protein
MRQPPSYADESGHQLPDDNMVRAMVTVAMMMVVRFCEGGSRQECNHGKQEDLFHILDDKRSKTYKV